MYNFVFYSLLSGRIPSVKDDTGAVSDGGRERV